jgi:hypothetical protein
MNTCGTCKYWKAFTQYENVPNTGDCSEISEKVNAEVEYGWDGGFVRAYETEEDFGCNLWKKKDN